MVFTGEEPVDSFVDDSNLSKTVQDQFNGMSFSKHEVLSQQFTHPRRVFIQRQPPTLVTSFHNIYSHPPLYLYKL